MKLAELIHKALIDPGVRMALESGIDSVTLPDLHPQELKALSEVMRRFNGAATKNLLDDVYARGIVPDWRED